MKKEQWAEVEARLEETLNSVLRFQTARPEDEESRRIRAEWDLAKLRDCLKELDLPQETA